MKTPRTFATYLLALSLFFVAGALVFFTLEVARVREQIPVILTSIEHTSSKIEPVVKEINGIRDLIPPILEEIKQSREQIPAILQEVRETRAQVPMVVKEITAIREKTPQILNSTDKMSEAVIMAAKEIKATRPLVPQVIKEIKTTREALPGMLDRADKLVAKASKAGQKVSEGAVSGVITGIITAPFKLVGNIGSALFGLSEEEAREYSEKDMSLLKQAGHDVLQANHVGSEKEWSNPETGYSGKVKLKSIDKDGQSECRTLHLQVWKKGKEKSVKDVTFCLNEQGQWIEDDEQDP